MLQQIRLAPGYVYDIILLFMMKVSPEEEWIARIIPQKKMKELYPMYQEILKKIPEIDPALRVFSLVEETVQGKSKRTMHVLWECWKELWRKNQKNFNLSIFVKEVSNSKYLVEKLWGEYFSGRSSKATETIAEEVEKLNLSVDMKFHLLCYLLQPEEYGQRLIEAIELIDQRYRWIYRQKQAALMECMERMDQKGLNQKVAAALEEREGRRVVDVSAEYLSFSAMNPYSLYYGEEKKLLLIGDEWDQNQDGKVLSSQNVQQICDVLGSKIKRNILQMIAQKGKMDSLQLSKELRLKENVSGRYLRELFLTGLLKREKAGKSYVYRIHEAQLKQYLYQLWNTFGQS
ncbi:MAG: helix-turn-helix transcriptional regulator [Lachnospiraceae bacterium]|jgi:predicted transcriptional regulator|nr:helix-turn-helix transcriptional regulator [Lachnospiraceae bacterium]